jgi:hypothetical protein
MKYIREVFGNLVDVRKQLWAGELWHDGYFMCSVGGTVDTEMIRQYIEYRIRGDNPVPFNMFDSNILDAPHPDWGSFDLLTGYTVHYA